MPKKLNWINIALILLIFPSVSLFARDYLIYRYAPQKIQKPPVQAPRVSGVSDINRYASVIEAPVFPSAVRHLNSLAAGPDDAKKADASAIFNELKLSGTFVGPYSFAIFEKKGDGERTFKKGDSLFDSGVLKDIQKGKAIVTSGGRDITLTMPEKDSFDPENPVLTNVSGAQEPPGAGAGPQTGKNLSQKTGENEWVINQKAILNALEDMSQVLSDARLTPVASKSGAIDGFLVGEIKPSGIFDAIGLRNGDILKRVNGFEIVSPERAVQVLTALKGETKIDLDVIRGGQKLNFHYEIR